MVLNRGWNGVIHASIPLGNGKLKIGDNGFDEESIVTKLDHIYEFSEIGNILMESYAEITTESTNEKKGHQSFLYFSIYDDFHKLMFGLDGMFGLEEVATWDKDTSNIYIHKNDGTPSQLNNKRYKIGDSVDFSNIKSVITGIRGGIADAHIYHEARRIVLQEPSYFYIAQSRSIADNFQYYKIDVKDGDILDIDLTSINHDSDLYIDVGRRPNKNTYRCMSANGGPDDSCRIIINNDNELYIGIYGYSPGDYRLEITRDYDLDGDGLFNSADTDDDNDGFLDTNDDLPLNPNEHTDTDNDGIGNNADTDDDNDDISDTQEIANGLNPLNASDAQADLDHDGFSNAIEISIGTDIRNARSKPIWTPIMMGDIITFMPAKR